jgi:hypothetical protein
LAHAEIGSEPSGAEIDPLDPVVVKLLQSAGEAIRDERARVEHVAAVWYVVELLRGRPIPLGSPV